MDFGGHNVGGHDQRKLPFLEEFTSQTLRGADITVADGSVHRVAEAGTAQVTDRLTVTQDRLTAE